MGFEFLAISICAMDKLKTMYFLHNLVLPKLITQTPEWKQAEKELLEERKMNPHSRRE